MFNNWINKNDLRRLRDKLVVGEWRQVSRKISNSAQDRTRAAWEHTRTPPLHAWEIPALQRRWNFLVSGDEKVDHVEYICRKYLLGEKNLAAFSPGCGTGGNELRWAGTGIFSRIDACDLSEPRIAAARAAAERSGLSGIIRFSSSDWRRAPTAAPYDLIIAEGALHHLHPMRPALGWIQGLLKPGGLLVVNDFVGPSRFQWTPRQLQAANAFLELIPENYKRRWRGGRVKARIDAPGRLRMRLADPSEAAESALIVPLLNELFIQLEIKGKGGALVPLVFHEIAHHYIQPDENAARILRLCFEIEDVLMRAGEIVNDYLFGIFQNPIP